MNFQITKTKTRNNPKQNKETVLSCIEPASFGMHSEGYITWPFLYPTPFHQSPTASLNHSPPLHKKMGVLNLVYRSDEYKKKRSMI